MDQRVDWGRDRDGISGDRMSQGDCFGLQKHAGAAPEAGAQGIAPLDACVTIISYDWIAGVKEVAADLVESSGFWEGFDEGEVVSQPFESFEVSVSFARRGAFLFSKWLLAGPEVVGRMAHDDGEVGFFDELLVESRAEDADDVGICCEEQNSAGGAVDPVKRVNGLPDLITENLHRDLVIRVGVIGGVDELSRRFVDGDEGVIAEEDLKSHQRLRVRPVLRRGPLFLSLGFLCWRGLESVLFPPPGPRLFLGWEA